MFGDIFTSTHEYIKSKLVNPFLGTLTFVWLVRNWFLVYSLFNFDENFRLKNKTDFIKNYLKEQDFWHEVYTNVWITLLLFVCSFIVLLITRYITNIYEFKLLPLVYLYSENKNLVTKERYNVLFQLSKDKDETLEQLRETINKLEGVNKIKNAEIVVLEEKVNELIIAVKSKEDEIEDGSALPEDNDDNIDINIKNPVDDLDYNNSSYPNNINTISLLELEGNGDDSNLLDPIINLSSNLNYSTIPQWFKYENNINTIKSRIGLFVNADDFRKLNRLQRLAVEHLERQNLVFEFLQIANYIKNKKNNRDYIDVSTIEFYTMNKLFEILSPPINNELEVKNIRLSNGGNLYFDFLTDQIALIQ